MATIQGAIRLDNGSVNNNTIASNAAIDADKMQHAYALTSNLGFAIDGTPTTRSEIVHVATQAGTVRVFAAGLNDTGTTTSIAFDLKKNGTTMLNAAVTVAHTDADRSVNTGTLSVASFVAGDVLSVSMTVTSSTGAQGPFITLGLEENAAP